jgi:glutamyl-tRNA reductase
VQLVALGINHTSSSVSLRERLAVSVDAIPDVSARLRDRVAEAFVLSTCNRIELYAVCGHESTGADILRDVLASYGNVSTGVVRQASYVLGHESVVRHLLRVAAGLDSMVLGENEILGQVRRALGAAREAGMTGPILDRLGDAALACGKRVRSVTTLGRNSESMTSVGLRLAARLRGGFDGAHIVVLGAGDTARQVLTQLGSVTAARVTVANRTHARARALATSPNATAISWEDLCSALATADVVIGCTSSPAPLLDVSTLVSARDGVGDRQLVCLDFGVPRDIDPAIDTLPGITLIDVDRLHEEVTAHAATRTLDVTRAETIVSEEVERYMDWWRARGVSSTVARLHARADVIRRTELDRALARLPGLTPQERAVVVELAGRVVGKLFHEPTLALKRDAEGANMAVVVERLFALDDVGGADRPMVREKTLDASQDHRETMAS